MAVARKLTAILVADVAGYSRLMRADETATYAAVRHLRDEVLPGVTAPHGGRLIKDMGDGFLITFDSAVQAVECGVALQQAMAGHEMLELRIGVNLGDVIVDGGDVFGDGVNIAARLEALCAPGGVAMAETVWDQVRDKLDLVVDRLEPQKLKNIDRPVGVRMWTGQAPAVPVDLSLPDKPSIAVLAFANMSSDPEQEFFAEGIAEDIITALSRIERFFVVSRTSSFSFKGRNVDVKEIGEALGVRYVLEGSVRAAGGRLRVTAQLIEAATGRHIWAEKYDRMAEDVFDIQDEITRNVTASTQTQIDLAEGAMVNRVERDELPVWKLINIAWRHVYELSATSLPKAIDLAIEAVVLQPASGRANQVLSAALMHHAILNSPNDSAELLDRAFNHAELAVSHAPNFEYAYWSRGMALFSKGEFAKARSDFERAIEINPNCSLAFGSLGTFLARTGSPEEAISATNISIRANPRDPSMFFRYWTLGLANHLLGDAEAAEAWTLKAIRMKPAWLGAYVLLMVVQMAKGTHGNAQETLAEVTRRHGEISLEDARLFSPQFDPDRENFFQCLRGLGIS